MPERQTDIRARCERGDEFGCPWDYNGPRSYIEADGHTSRTGHPTIVVETIRTVFTRPASSDKRP